MARRRLLAGVVIDLAGSLVLYLAARATGRATLERAYVRQHSQQHAVVGGYATTLIALDPPAG